MSRGEIGREEAGVWGLARWSTLRAQAEDFVDIDSGRGGGSGLVGERGAEHAAKSNFYFVLSRTGINSAY